MDPETGRKHRLRNLGLEGPYEIACERWTRLPDRTAELAALALERFRGRFRALGFREDILAVLAAADRPPAEDLGHRLLELRELQATKKTLARERIRDLDRDLE